MLAFGRSNMKVSGRYSNSGSYLERCLDTHCLVTLWYLHDWTMGQRTDPNYELFISSP